jgi:hypothetical protein
MAMKLISLVIAGTLMATPSGPGQVREPSREWKEATSWPGGSTFRLVDAGGKVLLSERDLVYYSWRSHTLVLRRGVIAKVNAALTGSLVGGIPFRVMANGVVCYAGVFTTIVSSLAQSCPVINVTPLPKDSEKWDKLSITLGYPTAKFFRGKDPRGDRRIQQALAALRKLKE